MVRLNGHEFEQTLGDSEGASQVVLVVNNLLANAGDIRDTGLIPGWGKIPWKRAW